MKTQNRRQMMKGSLRYAVLSLVGFFAGFEIVKRRRLKSQGKCIARGICAGCEIYKDCRLPQALSKKQFFAEKNNADRKK